MWLYNYEVGFEAYICKGMFELYKNYDEDKDCFWLCEHKQKIVGCIALGHIEQGSVQLRFFYIEPEYRSIGLGKKLMQLFMEFMKEKGYKHSFLWTVSDLVSALSLYTRNGFVLSEEMQTDRFGKLLTEQRYDLHL